LTIYIYTVSHPETRLRRLLREYLDEEMRVDNLPFKFDLERAIDDFVLLCTLVGNDFLPHSPVLDISEGAMDTIFDTYRAMLPVMGGFLTLGESIDHARLEQFMQKLAEREMETLVKRAMVRPTTHTALSVSPSHLFQLTKVINTIFLDVNVEKRPNTVAWHL
jgi:5'-3' exonuclease